MAQISYTIEQYDPANEYVLVKYTSPSDSNLEYYRSFNPMDWDSDSLIGMIHGFGSTVLAYWDRTASHSPTMTIASSATFEAEPEVRLDYIPNPQIEPEPAYDPWTQYIVMNDVTDPYQATIGWTVVDMDSAEQQAFYDQQVTSMTNERNYILSTTDFIFATDITVVNDSDWLAYRQDLRNLTDQAGWPQTVTWPERPDLILG